MLEEYLTDKMCSWVNLYQDSVTDVTLIENENMFLSVNGSILDTDCFVSKNLLQSIVTNLCNKSVYASQQTLKKGYVTLPDGCRVGMTGTAVTDADGHISHLRNINAVNIRISRDIKNAAENVIGYICNKEIVFNTLIIAPPGAGKTTMLRDVAMRLGENFRVGIADERDEIIPPDRKHRHVFVMRGTKKHDGMLSILRSMSPEVILTDEIGTYEDERAILKLINAGVKIVCTAHGYDETDLLRREVFKSLIEEEIFETIIVLSSRCGVGTVEKIICTGEMENG